MQREPIPGSVPIRKLFRAEFLTARDTEWIGRLLPCLVRNAFRGAYGTPSALVSSGVKIHEILIIMVVVYVAWHSAWQWLGAGVPNLIEMQWGFIAMSMVWISKHLLQKESSSFDRMMGSPFAVADLMEVSYITLINIIVGIGCWAFLIFLFSQWNPVWVVKHFHLIDTAKFIKFDTLKSWMVIYVICGVVLAPITEEIVFRGFILRSLRRKYSVRTAILVSALIFALFHFDKNFVGSFFHGIIFAAVAVRFSSLYVPMIVHGLYNAIAFSLDRGVGFFSVDVSLIGSMNYWIPELLCFLVGGGAVILYFHKVARLQNEKVRCAAIGSTRSQYV